jgi:type IV pilus assembly protein PilM
MFFSKQKSIVGVDIGTSYIKLAQITHDQSGGTGKVLDTYGIVNTSGKAGSSNTDSFIHDTAALLSNLLDKARVSTKRCVASLPNSSVFTSVIDMPTMTESEMASAMQYEAKKYVPLPFSEVNLSWSVISRSDDSKTSKVLLIAVPIQVKENYIKLFELAGLQLEILEIEALALIRSLIIDTNRNSAIIDIGAKATGVNVVKDGLLQLTRNKILKATVQRQVDAERELALLGHFLERQVDAARNGRRVDVQLFLALVCDNEVAHLLRVLVDVLADVLQDDDPDVPRVQHQRQVVTVRQLRSEDKPVAGGDVFGVFPACHRRARQCGRPRAVQAGVRRRLGPFKRRHGEQDFARRLLHVVALDDTHGFWYINCDSQREIIFLFVGRLVCSLAGMAAIKRAVMRRAVLVPYSGNVGLNRVAVGDKAWDGTHVDLGDSWKSCTLAYDAELGGGVETIAFGLTPLQQRFFDPFPKLPDDATVYDLVARNRQFFFEEATPTPATCVKLEYCADITGTELDIEPTAALIGTVLNEEQPIFEIDDGFGTLRAVVFVRAIEGGRLVTKDTFFEHVAGPCVVKLA